MGWPKKGYCRVCCKVSQLSKSEGRASKVKWSTTRYPNSYLEVTSCLHGFHTGSRRTRKQYDYISVVVYRMIKYAHFYYVKCSYSAKNYGRIYIDKIVSLHGDPLSIIMDRGDQFTSRFWILFQRVLGSQMKLSTTSKSQTDG